jgi:hypothetical protein
VHCLTVQPLGAAPVMHQPTRLQQAVQQQLQLVPRCTCQAPLLGRTPHAAACSNKNPLQPVPLAHLEWTTGVARRVAWSMHMWHRTHQRDVHVVCLHVACALRAGRVGGALPPSHSPLPLHAADSRQVLAHTHQGDGPKPRANKTLVRVAYSQQNTTNTYNVHTGTNRNTHIQLLYSHTPGPPPRTPQPAHNPSPSLPHPLLWGAPQGLTTLTGFDLPKSVKCSSPAPVPPTLACDYSAPSACCHRLTTRVSVRLTAPTAAAAAAAPAL